MTVGLTYTELRLINLLTGKTFRYARLSLTAEGRVGPVRIELSNRRADLEARVIGDEPLLGVIPIEAMDCVVDPTTQELRVNPAHLDFAVYRV
jgi:hypothetical protein